MIKLMNLLKEIGDASSQPYNFEFIGDYEDTKVYGFNTDSYPYTVEIFHDEDESNIISIRFYVVNENNPDIELDNIVTNKRELFKVMATITAIVKSYLKSHPEVDTLAFIPSKKSGETDNISRLNLYLKYIKYEYPNAIVSKYEDTTILVKIKNTLQEILSTPNTIEDANKKINDLPPGKIFDDAKNIKNIFKMSQHSWSEVIEMFEKNSKFAKPEYINISNIHITQQNIQSDKAKKIIVNLDKMEPINVVEFKDGEKAIYDGHHRLVANWALGEQKIKVNLVRL